MTRNGHRKQLKVDIPFPRPFACHIYTIRVMYRPLFPKPQTRPRTPFFVIRPVQDALLMLNSYSTSQSGSITVRTTDTDTFVALCLPSVLCPANFASLAELARMAPFRLDIDRSVTHCYPPRATLSRPIEFPFSRSKEDERLLGMRRSSTLTTFG